MADNDTGTVERFLSFGTLGMRRCDTPELKAYKPQFVNAEDFDRLSRELAEAEAYAAARERHIVLLAKGGEQLLKQLAESERLAAARNRLNGELPLENVRLRAASRK